MVDTGAAMRAQTIEHRTRVRGGKYVKHVVYTATTKESGCCAVGGVKLLYSTCFRSSILSASDMSSSAWLLVGAPRCPALPPAPLHPSASAFDNKASSRDTTSTMAHHLVALQDNLTPFLRREWGKAIVPLALGAPSIVD